MKITLSLAAAGLCSLSFGQFSDNFESETGSAGGTVASGQNGWYLPTGIDSSIYTYSGNSLGAVSNPTGGNQFLGGMSQGGTNIARAQHDVDFSAGGVWTMSFDFLGGFSGTPPAADNLGSVSLQPSATANIFQTIYQWANPVDNTQTATAFSANIGHATATGGALAFDSPGTDWQNLPVNHWFHQTVTWDFTTGAILDTTLQDLTAGGPVNDFTPVDWFLAGGAANIGGLPGPTAARFFVGGGAGNFMGFDNFSVTPVPEPASLAVVGLGAIALLRRRRK